MCVRKVSSAAKVTQEKYRVITPEDKVKEQNRIRQWAFKACEKMPKDFKSFCMVAEHLAKNAHRYWDINVEDANKIKLEAEEQVSKRKKTTENMDIRVAECMEVNKTLCEIQCLRWQNRIREQQALVSKLFSHVGTYRELSWTSGIALKTLHEWCSPPKQ